MMASSNNLNNNMDLSSLVKDSKMTTRTSSSSCSSDSSRSIEELNDRRAMLIGEELEAIKQEWQQLGQMVSSALDNLYSGRSIPVISSQIVKRHPSFTFQSSQDNVLSDAARKNSASSTSSGKRARSPEYEAVKVKYARRNSVENLRIRVSQLETMELENTSSHMNTDEDRPVILPRRPSAALLHSPDHDSRPASTTLPNVEPLSSQALEDLTKSLKKLETVVNIPYNVAVPASASSNPQLATQQLDEWLTRFQDDWNPLILLDVNTFHIVPQEFRIYAFGMAKKSRSWLLGLTVYVMMNFVHNSMLSDTERLNYLRIILSRLHNVLELTSVATIKRPADVSEYFDSNLVAEVIVGNRSGPGVISKNLFDVAFSIFQNAFNQHDTRKAVSKVQFLEQFDELYNCVSTLRLMSLILHGDRVHLISLNLSLQFHASLCRIMLDNSLFILSYISRIHRVDDIWTALASKYTKAVLDLVSISTHHSLYTK